jgi:LmbE family N-acetylglucosaminyl deacetylase
LKRVTPLARLPFMRWAWLVALLTGCGDNLVPEASELARARDLSILAHQGDDLVYLQPDLLELAQRGGLTNIYVTAGDGQHTGDELSDGHYQSLLAAYGGATGHNSWSCGVIQLAGRSAEHCRNDAAFISLVFLGYPDGGPAGDRAQSLLHLWQGDVDDVPTVGLRDSTYNQQGLIDALAEVIDAVKPRTVRTLEIASTHGDEHSDHMLVGALAVLAVAASQEAPELLAFRGESTLAEPANLPDALAGRSTIPISTWRGSVLANDNLRVHRRYAVGTRAVASGQLRNSGMCASANSDGSLALTDCATAEHWLLAADGTLHVGQRCVQTLPTGELVAGDDCAPVARQRFVLDDEGHIWLGNPPLPEPDMATAHLWCLDVAGGRPRAALCGKDHAPLWELSEAPTSTAKPAGITRTGRALRLADVDGDRLADLCSIEATGLRCAHGDGQGGFAASQLVVAFAIEPESLTIGDVDGDGKADACGRASDGVHCATEINGYSDERWSPAFAHSGGADASDRSFAATPDGDGPAQVCGLASDGFLCAPHDLNALPPVRSDWPDPAAPLWPGDLDGDHHADWCIAAPDGAACGVDAERLITSEGVRWSFTFVGAADPAPADTALGALADIDGDLRADLCRVVDTHVLCARSQGRGFGPTATIATLPAGSLPTALLLGDLDGDGRADACVDRGATLLCVRSP